MTQEPFSTQTTALPTQKRRLRRFSWIICLLAMFAGIFCTFFVLSLQGHARADTTTTPGDCHNDSKHLSDLLTEADFNILDFNTSNSTDSHVGYLRVQLLYCRPYQSVFMRFLYTVIPGITSDDTRSYNHLNGTCNLYNASDTPVQDGCQNGLDAGSSLDTAIVYGPGQQWAAAWNIAQNSSRECQADVSNPPFAGQSCQTDLAQAPSTSDSDTGITSTPTPTPTSANTSASTNTNTNTNGTDPAALRQACHTNISTQGNPPTPNLPYSYEIGSWQQDYAGGTLTAQLYYCQWENSVFGVFSFSGSSLMGSCSLKASYGTISQSKHIDSVYNKTSPYVYGICSSQTDQFTITPDNSGSRQQQTMLGETYSGDTWQLCWETQSNNAQCSPPIDTPAS